MKTQIMYSGQNVRILSHGEDKYYLCPLTNENVIGTFENYLDAAVAAEMIDRFVEATKS
jgi:hypothetical protein